MRGKQESREHKQNLSQFSPIHRPDSFHGDPFNAKSRMRRSQPGAQQIPALTWVDPSSSGRGFASPPASFVVHTTDSKEEIKVRPASTSPIATKRSVATRNFQTYATAPALRAA